MKHKPPPQPDLGGIEISRSRLVITIGLATITHNESATAIIIAAGDAKASIVREAIEEPKNPKNPASALQDLRNAKFYLTKGAASLLTERRFIDFCALRRLVMSIATILSSPWHLSMGRDWMS